ncbi:hypothetical protein CVT24_002711 [Panaeolus cyanescens]|uniref:Lysine-specific metallo-endopeptidase domain-containing protein n=1 Tax=Panaeolus cyanescens TaxID=181874 RepID=A0A409YY68_9AGAR|nr:hypothetical protein CVT24_002711 [Panaeolus cyanescens]
MKVLAFGFISAYFISALGIPVPSQFHLTFDHQPPPDMRQILDADVEEVNYQLHAMRNIVDCVKEHVPQCITDMAYVFGPKFDIKGIEGILRKLETATVHIKDYNVKGMRGHAQTFVEDQFVLLGERFWKLGPGMEYLRAWALIHEATHLFGTYDWWLWEDASKTSLTPVSKSTLLERTTEDKGLNGYAMRDYHTIMGNAKDKFHLNADTWAVFGYYVTRGLMPPQLCRSKDEPLNHPHPHPQAPSIPPQRMGSGSRPARTPRFSSQPPQGKGSAPSHPSYSSEFPIGPAPPRAPTPPMSEYGSRPAPRPVPMNAQAPPRRQSASQSRPHHSGSDHSRHSTSQFDTTSSAAFEFASLCSSLPKTEGSRHDAPDPHRRMGRYTTPYQPTYPSQSQHRGSTTPAYSQQSMPDTPYSPPIRGSRHALGMPIQSEFKSEFKLEFAAERQPPPDMRKALDEDVAEVNWQIQSMRHIVEGAKQCDERSIMSLVNVFGSEFQLKEIDKILGMLEKMTVQIKNYRAKDSGSYGMAHEHDKTVELEEAYWRIKRDSDKGYMKSFVLIHEATHLLGTYDWWAWNDESRTSLRIVTLEERHENPKIKAEALSGYTHLNYGVVKKYAKGNFHLNADTWGVFGYYAIMGIVPPDVLKGTSEVSSPRQRTDSISSKSSSTGSQSPPFQYDDPAYMSTTERPNRPQSPSPPRQQTGSIRSKSSSSSISSKGSSTGSRSPAFQYDDPVYSRTPGSPNHTNAQPPSPPPQRTRSMGSRPVNAQGQGQGGLRRQSTSRSKSPPAVAFDFAAFCSTLPNAQTKGSKHVAANPHRPTSGSASQQPMPKSPHSGRSGGSRRQSRGHGVNVSCDDQKKWELIKIEFEEELTGSQSEILRASSTTLTMTK